MSNKSRLCVLTCNTVVKASTWGRVLRNTEGMPVSSGTLLLGCEWPGVMFLQVKAGHPVWGSGPSELVQQTLKEETGVWESASKGSGSQEFHFLAQQAAPS